MTKPLDSVGAITMFVDDPQRSKVFYADVFGAPVIFEDETSVAFRFESTIVNLVTAESAQELIEPASVGRRDAGSRFQLTVWVDDADAASVELRARGVELLNGPQDREWGVRTAAFADPDGHIWEIAQPLGEPEAS